MAFTIIAGGSTRGLQDSSIVHIDAAVNVTPRLRNTVTAHPVEGGSNVSDHVFRQNTTIDVQGCIVNFPFRDAPDAGLNRVREQYRQLSRLKELRQFVTIRTELETFTSCVITSLSFPRTAQVGDSLQFSITFEQLQIVQADEIIASSDLLDRILRPQKVGNKEAVDAETPGNSEEDQTLLGRAGRWFRENLPNTTNAITDLPTPGS